jgi:hypothetical protein
MVIESCRKDAVMGWYGRRLWIYTPEGNINRSSHLDGRGGDPKFDNVIEPLENAE